jgi:catechol 2,3-dioxygenase-like lactoylglutathione lyase family enzyme
MKCFFSQYTINMIRIFVLMMLFYSCAGTKQTQTVVPAVQPYFAALKVKNVDSSINWYSNVFNLKLRDRTDNEQRGFKQANLTNGEIFFELIEQNKSISQETFLKDTYKGYSIQGFAKLGFAVADIEAWHRLLQDKHIRFYGSMVTDKVSGKKTFLVSDPDGNLLQFFER